MIIPRRGEVYLVRFDPSVGYETKKTRPAVIIQNDTSNEFSPITIVAAISSTFATPSHPREVIIQPGESGLGGASAAILNQIRSIDHSRLVRRIGVLDASTMRRIDRAIAISLGLVPV